MAVARRARTPGAPRRCSPWASAPSFATTTRRAGSRRAATTRRRLRRRSAAQLVLERHGLLPHANAGALFGHELAQLRAVSACQGMMLETLRRPRRRTAWRPDKDARSGAWTRSRPPASCGSRSRPGCWWASARPARTGSRTLEAIADSHERRPRPRGDHPELPAQAAHRDGRRPAAPRRGVPLDDRRGAPGAARRRAPPGAAQPGRRPGRLLELGHRRLRRHLAGDARPRQPRAGVARARRRWPRSARRQGYALVAAPHGLPRVRRRRATLARRGGAAPRARSSCGRRAFLAATTRGSRRHRRPPPPLRRSPRPHGGRVARSCARYQPGYEFDAEELVTLFAARGARLQRGRRRRRRRASRASSATTSPSSSTATSTTRTSARSSAGSAPSPRVRSRSTCAATPTCLTLDEISERVREAEATRRHRGLPPGRHPPQVRRRLLHRRGRGGARGLAARSTSTPSARSRSSRALVAPSRTSPTYLTRLKDAGLKTLPGTAAEILDDEVRAVLCPDKINTDQWLEVHRAAHASGCAPTSRSCSAPSRRRRAGRRTCCARGRCSRRPAASPSSCRCPSCTWRRRSSCKGRPGGARRSARRC